MFLSGNFIWEFFVENWSYLGFILKLLNINFWVVGDRVFIVYTRVIFISVVLGIVFEKFLRFLSEYGDFMVFFIDLVIIYEG